MKYCPQCKQNLDDSKFHKCRAGINGLSWICKECRKEYAKTHSRKAYFSLYKKANREKLNTLNTSYRKKYISEWLDYFKKKYSNGFQCAVCKIQLSLDINGVKKQSEVVHFDHRNGADRLDEMKMGPNAWLRGHRCNERNVIFWESFNFGILCRRCNSILPTENRKEWFEQIRQYIYGV